MIQQIDTLDDLVALVAKPGEQVYCAETQKIYVYTPDSEWVVAETRSDITMSAYEINSQIIRQLEPLNREKFLAAYDVIDKVRNDSEKYMMLLSWDNHYFTLFHKSTDDFNETFMEILYECIMNMTDTIYSIEIVNYSHAEIWVRDVKTDKAIVMYLFPYDAGVVEVPV